MLIKGFYSLCLKDASLDELLSALTRLLSIDGAAIVDTNGNLLAQTGAMPPDGSVALPLVWKSTPLGALLIDGIDKADIPPLVQVSLAGQIYSFCKAHEKDARLLRAMEREEPCSFETLPEKGHLTALNDTFFLLYADINDLDERSIQALYEDAKSVIPVSIDAIAINGKGMSVLYRQGKSRQAFFQALSGLMQRYEIRGALSQPFDGKRLSQQMCLLRLAIRAGSTIYPEQFLFRFDSLASFILFLAVQRNLRIANYYSEEVLRIINYDYENGTELSRSLYVYLFYFMDLKEAARDVNIHRNTLDYHVKKIGQILDFLPNAAQRFEMMCTYGMLAMEENI